ncbi:HIT domain-containing protein [Gimesia panareensis]|uniref:HIT domain-containing protein n=1 Tax=Gimesia panareensis TaxID=2527978 RepID=UPI00118AB062|nr:HIT domain-containing protein [Gimesia panareensis]QDU52492.1 HIT domain protein [Gimesia panareensis]
MQLDARLQADCSLICELTESSLLLMNNALVDWFILVPHCEEIELTNLPFDRQTAILQQVNLVARYLQQNCAPDKLNIATLGNVVSQLHIHVIGRKQTDPYWPAPVWGQPERRDFTEPEIEQIRQAFSEFLQQQSQ